MAQGRRISKPTDAAKSIKDTKKQLNSAIQAIHERLREANPRKYDKLDRELLDATMYEDVKDRMAKVKRLLKAGADVDARDKAKGSCEGMTPLMNAAMHGHNDICKLLIEKGADVNAKSNNGWSVLTWTASSGRTENCALLIEKGAKIDARSEGGFTPLMEAAENGYTDTFRLLIEKGADVYARSNRGWTVLMNAAGAHSWVDEKKVMEICELLIEKGLDVNEGNDEGGTPLMKASFGGNTEVCRLLLEKGAKMWIKDDYGKNAIMHAIESGEKETVKFLRLYHLNKILVEKESGIFFSKFKECIR